FFHLVHLHGGTGQTTTGETTLNHTQPQRLTEEPAVRVVAHPPERRRPVSGIPRQAGGCCCCCCCWRLHSGGGIIGSFVGSLTRVDPTYVETTSPCPYRLDEPEPGYGWFPTLTFWMLFSLLTLLVWAAFLASQGSFGPNNVLWSGILTLLVLPGVQ